MRNELFNMNTRYDITDLIDCYRSIYNKIQKHYNKNIIIMLKNRVILNIFQNAYCF